MKFRIYPPKSIKLIIITTFLLLFISMPTYAALWSNKVDTQDLQRIITELRVYDDPELPYYNEIFRIYYHDSKELLNTLNNKIEITQHAMNILDAEIKKEELGNLTYGRYLLNAINEEELVEIGIKTGSPGQENGEYFSKLSENLADWESQLSKFLLTKIIGATCTAMGVPVLSIGISTLGLSCDLSIIGISINKLKEVWYEKAFWSYVQFRNDHDFDHYDAWKGYAETQVKYVLNLSLLSLEKQEKAKRAIEENFKSLWDEYGEHIVNHELNKNFKSKQRESLKIFLLYALGAEAKPIIISPLKITPLFPYQVEDTVNAEFIITNQGTLPIKFNVLTVGGRDLDNQVADFSYRQNIILWPLESYDFKGTLTLNKVGDYHFFCTYQTPDGEWNTNIDVGSKLTEDDREVDIYVKENIVNQPPDPPANLAQFESDGETKISIGGKTDGHNIILKGKVKDLDSDKARLEVEIKRLDEYGGQFDEDKGGIQQSDLFENNSEIMIPVNELADDDYHWRARVIDEHDLVSEWISFGGNPDSAVDFSVGQEVIAPIITSPLKITPDSPYYVGDTVNAEFTISNKDSIPITFSVLTVGGRDPDDQVADFTHRQNITIEPSQSYDYRETLTLNKVGNYHFFCTYQTPNGEWNANVDVGSKLTDGDRVEDIIVKEKGETSTVPDISEELKFSAPPEVIWSRELYEPWPRYIMQTPDGGYIFASTGGCDREFISLIKLDSFGQKTGESRLRYRCPWVLSLQKTPDGGYILLAFTDEIGGVELTLYLIKTDASGHKIWDKRFNEKDQSGRESDIIRYLEVGRGVEPYFFAEQTPDGGYILAGVIYYKDSEKYHPWLIKTDSKGDKQWEKIFEEEGVISSLQQTSDGGYILVVRGWLIKTDAFGQKVFKKIFEEKKAHRLQQTPDGGYILTGVIVKDSKHYPWLIKTNSNVDEQWEKIFEDEMWPYFVQQTPDGGYILVGNTKDNIRLIKTDASGQKIWNWTEKAEYPELESFQQTSDGGYIVLMDSQLIKLGSLEETQKEQVTEFFEEFKEEEEKEISPYHVEYKPIVTANIFTDLLVNVSGPADELGIILTNPEGWSTTRFISKRDLIDNFESVKVSLCKKENPPSGAYNLIIKTITPEKTVYQKEIKFNPPVLEVIDAKVRIIETEGSRLGGSYIGRGHYLTDVDIVVKNWGDLPLILRRIVITLRGQKTQEMNLDQFKGVPYGETKIKEGGKRGSYLWNFDEDIFHSAVIKLYSFSEKDCLAEYQAELRVERYDSIWDVDEDY